MLTDRIDHFRRCGVPIVAVSTIDGYAVVDRIVRSSGDGPILVWDGANGAHAVNDAGATCLPEQAPDPFGGPPDPGAFLAGPALQLPQGAIVVMLGADRWINTARPVASCLALRDPYKATGRTLILCGHGLQLPGDLAPHVESIDDPPPDDGARELTIRSLYRDAEVNDPPADAIAAAVAGTRGLPAFGVEQAAALAMGPKGIDLEQLRARWSAAINATAGLRIDTTRRTLGDLGGLRSIKAFAQRIAGSKRPPAAVVLIDEGGKALAGGGASGAGDNTGVSQDFEACLLQEMQDTGADGLIAFGVPGAGKSASAQAIAAALSVPLIRLDLGGMKTSRLGESEANMRRALSTIRALAGRAFWVLTCNELITIKAEIRRRFRSGVWFYDVPTVEELTTIRTLYADRYSIPVDQPWPDMTGWTGAEVETLCERADAWNVSPVVAAEWIVPVSKMSSETVDAMRRAAAGRFLSASHPGPYSYGGPAAAVPTGRRLSVGGRE